LNLLGARWTITVTVLTILAVGAIRTIRTTRGWLRGRLILRWAGLGLRRARLYLPEGAAQGVQLTLVFDLLPLGQFERFQQFIQILQHLLQGFGDAVNIFNGLAHGGHLRGGRRGRWLPLHWLRPDRAFLPVWSVLLLPVTFIPAG